LLMTGEGPPDWATIIFLGLATFSPHSAVVYSLKYPFLTGTGVSLTDTLNTHELIILIATVGNRPAVSC